MIARSSKLSHPKGIEISTPLLVPSYSSKGFEMNVQGKSSVSDPMMTCKEFLEESLLVSAYDLYHKHIPDPLDFVSTAFVIIDSGGYETGQNYDFSATKKYKRETKDWDKQMLIKVLKSWPDIYPTIIVNYDNERERVQLSDQIDQAQSIFDQFPSSLHDFLIKPDKETSHLVDLKKVIPHVKRFKEFDIIGITEKELGYSIYNRMRNIRDLRKALDKAKIKAPLHIFGSLDPVTSILYFLSGAEIFDGLTWLRYSYHKAMAIYNPNFSFFNKDIDIRTHDRRVQLKSLTNNIYFLDRMKFTMQDFLMGKDFNQFNNLGINNLGELLEKSIKSID